VTKEVEKGTGGGGGHPFRGQWEKESRPVGCKGLRGGRATRLGSSCEHRQEERESGPKGQEKDRKIGDPSRRDARRLGWQVVIKSSVDGHGGAVIPC